jgi:hypothetical protein
MRFVCFYCGRGPGGEYGPQGSLVTTTPAWKPFVWPYVGHGGWRKSYVTHAVRLSGQDSRELLRAGVTLFKCENIWNCSDCMEQSEEGQRRIAADKRTLARMLAGQQRAMARKLLPLKIGSSWRKRAIHYYR